MDMKKYFYVCIAVLLAGCLWSCQSAGKASASLSDLDGEWNVIEMNGKKLDPAQAKQVIGIEASTKRLFGNAGCNRIMGQVEYTDAHKNIIKFPHVGTTRMACPDMKGENEFLQTLNKVVRFEAVGKKKSKSPITEIALYGMDNTKLMVLQKK